MVILHKINFVLWSITQFWLYYIIYWLYYNIYIYIIKLFAISLCIVFWATHNMCIFIICLMNDYNRSIFHLSVGTISDDSVLLTVFYLKENSSVKILKVFYPLWTFYALCSLKSKILNYCQAFKHFDNLII